MIIYPISSVLIPFRPAIQFKPFQDFVPLGGKNMKGGKKMKPNENETKKELRKCAGCRVELEYGKDVLALERVVIGPRGPIPVG